MSYPVRRGMASVAAALLLLGATITARVSAHPPNTPLFRIIEIPGKSQIFARDINNRGAIVGYASLATARQIGFIKLDRFIGEVDFPNSLLTTAWGINDRGEIVGSLVGGGYVLSKGEFTLLPGISPESINDHGDIVGVAAGGRDGFLRTRDGAFTTIRLPNSNSTRAHGINDRGQIVGDFEDVSLHERGFLFWGGEFRTIQVPGSSRTEAIAINNFGQVVGKFVGPDGEQGFLWRAGKFTIISIPESVTTNVFGINDWGEIVGIYVDTSGNGFGFQSHVKEFQEH
jgi:uncharacterized membrane protein